MHIGDIFEINEKHKIWGEIYRITNNKTAECYVGQTVSHRLNKGKYRPFGIYGRFKDHISEAINNTKKKQCTYLNNAIRKYGSKSFRVDLLYKCPLTELDSKEIQMISKHNCLYPNGYNLTTGGRAYKAHCEKIIGDTPFNAVKKRGREFGYKHTNETRLKMSKRLHIICASHVVKQRMSKVMTDYYDTKKIVILSKFIINNAMEVIKPIKSKITGKVHDYMIKIGGKKYGIYSNKYSPKEKLNKLCMLIAKSQEMRTSNNHQDIPKG